jgi:hypothetical protein
MCESPVACLRSAIITGRLDQFTAYCQLALEASQGITVVIGTHGT